MADPRAEESLRLDLADGLGVLVRRAADGWSAQPVRVDGDGWRAAVAGDGASAAVLRVLAGDDVVPEPWRVLRLGATAVDADADDEVAVMVDQTNSSVVVGDSAVVKWRRSVRDAVHPGPSALAHLAAVGFAGIPRPLGQLLVRSPSGHELPVAQADAYLPGARDGWAWCLELVRAVAAGDDDDPWTRDFPARLGRLAADLHDALATPSDVLPDPRRAASAGEADRWHAAALARVDEAIDSASALDGALDVIRPRADALRAALAPVAHAAGTTTQRLHGDLHVGQVLRWSDGLAVVDFDGNPVVAADGDAIRYEPAARDLAQLLRSLDHVARVAIRRTEGIDVGAVLGWLAGARPQLLDAYRDALARLDASDLLDEPLLRAFEVEQECREIIYAARHLPRWAYAPLGAVEAMFPADGSATEWRTGGC